MHLDELKQLYQHVRTQLRMTHLVSADNVNVVSVRLPISTCDEVRHLAYRRHATISDVVRDAVQDYCKQEKGSE